MFFGALLLNWIFNRRHKYSTGFKSGDCNDNSTVFILLKFFRRFSCMLKVIILLQNSFISKSKLHYWPKQISVQIILVYFGIHSIISKIPVALSENPSQNHHIATTKFHLSDCALLWVIELLRSSSMFSSYVHKILSQNDSGVFLYARTYLTGHL